MVRQVLRISIVVLVVMVPAFLMNFATYSFYEDDVSVVKVAFKHSGKRVVDCDEEGILLREAARYRELYKQTGSVEMDIDVVGKCPRERWPVSLRVELDSQTLLDRRYMPAGIRRDLATYIYEEFLVEPGQHTLLVRMHDSDPKTATAGYVREEKVELRPGRVLLIRFDDRADAIVFE